jgi:outer membrane receptor for ferrienterochelin and colicin
MRIRIGISLAMLLLVVAASRAGIFAVVRGVVHDPSHRPIAGAKVTLKSSQSDWSAAKTTNDAGEFTFEAVPAGTYSIRVERDKFGVYEQTVTVASDTAPVLHIGLEIAAASVSVQVNAPAMEGSMETAATQNSISMQQIHEMPGAERTNSFSTITNTVPGAYVVHDQLHIRGGHQVDWLVDGVPVPNTNIASNVGTQFNPLDIETVEIQRGGYSAEYGDRTYGVFNVIPRTGFERNREAELVTTFGNYYSTDDQLSFGDHTSRFAYYASVSGNRSDYGLETPTPGVLHDRGDGGSIFTSLIFNATPADQLRLVASMRRDVFQIPNDPDAQTNGIRDLQNERDGFANFSWVHTIGTGAMLIVSPFYHFNRSAYDGGMNDPLVTTDRKTSQYGGAQVTLGIVRGKHNARFGVYGFSQHDNEFFGLADNTAGEIASFTQSVRPTGNLEVVFAEDQFKVTNWLTLNGGIRLTHFGGLISENAASPRAGATIEIPKLHWVLRGSYGRYYQAPPLSTVSGPLAQFAVESGFAFLPLRGERDEQYEVGLAIPVHGWMLDTDVFRTHSHNFFDHDVVGDSNIFLPLTIANARIYGWEATLHTPRAAKHWQGYVTYSRQFVQGAGGITGGLTDFSPPDAGLFFLDHDQRDTLTVGGSYSGPWHSRLSASVNYGSGFLNGNGPGHLPAHATVNFSAEKSFGEKFSVGVTALNIGGTRYLLDNSNTFGGTHFTDPRMIYGSIRWRFHY